MFNPELAAHIRQEKFSSEVVFINITDYRQCDHAIRKADIVAGLLPDAMMIQVADLCIANKKNFVTPARLNRQMVSRKSKIEENGMLVLMECGFAPGLDHITAKKAIDNIHVRGGRISTFKTFHGSVLAESAINNSLEFKLTEPVSEVLLAGRHNNRHVIKGRILHIPYHQVFDRAEAISVSGLNNIRVIPEGDSLYLRKIYDLSNADTVVKGRLMRGGFVSIFALLVKLGLTDMQSKIEMFEKSSFYNYLDSLLPYSEGELLEYRLQKYAGASQDDILNLRCLGLLDHQWVQSKDPTPAHLLQHLLEKRFLMGPDDKDCIVMRHHLEYSLKNARHTLQATLVVEGESGNDMAIDKVISLTTGAALKACMLDNIKAKGLFIPTTSEIYDPILSELLDLGVAFHVEESRMYGFCEEKTMAEQNSIRTAS